jgi:hypothetical protein
MPVLLLLEGLTTIDGLISATCQQLNSYVDLYRSMENLSIDYRRFVGRRTAPLKTPVLAEKRGLMGDGR